MANLYTRVETVSNAGATLATYGANALKNVISTSDAGRTLIVSVTRTTGNGAMTNDILNSVINAYMTQSQGVAGVGDSAFTVAGVGTADGTPFVSGTTQTVFLRLQGTGNLTDASADLSIANVTVATVAVFTPAK